MWCRRPFAGAPLAEADQSEPKGRAKTTKIILQVHLDQIPAAKRVPTQPLWLAAKQRRTGSRARRAAGSPGEPFVPVLGPSDP